MYDAFTSSKIISQTNVSKPVSNQFSLTVPCQDVSIVVGLFPVLGLPRNTSPGTLSLILEPVTCVVRPSLGRPSLDSLISDVGVREREKTRR